MVNYFYIIVLKKTCMDMSVQPTGNKLKSWVSYEKTKQLKAEY